VKENRDRSRVNRNAVTLIELVVVLSILSLLAGILFPVLHMARRKAQSFHSMNNQRHVVGVVDLFATDNGDRYPPSIAKVGFNQAWNWSDSTKLAGSDLRTPGLYRSVSAYLRSYLPAVDPLHCPSSPRRYQYLQQAWDSSDGWDNPETPVSPDVVGGTYCLYWNYMGWLGQDKRPFSGPQGPASGRPYSTLLIGDYFGYNPWRTPGAYGSCEPFKGAEAAPETVLLSSYWYEPLEANASPRIRLHAGYTDGHVAAYSSMDVVPLRVIKLRTEMVPYGDDEPGPGIFYLPREAVR
jgi:prepilin-type N-terminal cleavage/methylation domain-containing protein